MKKIKMLVVCSMLFIAGCGGAVQMSPVYEQNVRQSQHLIREYNTRCQSGDEDACVQGLQDATDLIDYIVEGIN